MRQATERTNGHKVRFDMGATGRENTEYRFSIAFYVFMENGLYISYCPALDISTSGKDFNEAVMNFYECFRLHVECCIENGTLAEDLTAHGWRVRGYSITPPPFRSLMRERTFRELMNNNAGYERVVAPVRIPALA